MSRTQKKASLSDLVAQLSVHSNKDEYDGIVSTAKKILVQSPSDKGAYDALIKTYINHDKYSELHKQLSSTPTKQQEYLLEYGYSLYKLGKHSDLVQLVGDRQERGILHLLAQSYYKQGLYLQARSIYSKFANTLNQVDHESYDIAINERAIFAQLKFSDASFDASLPSSSSTQSYDQLFNSALVFIAAEDYPKALELLTKAKAICQSTPGFSPEDLAAELTPILVQASYVNIKLSDNEQAASILNTIDYDNLSDSSSLYLINNLKLILDGGNKYKNPHTALAFLDSAKPYQAVKPLFVPLQQKILNNNRFIVELASGKSPLNLLKRAEFSVDKSLEGYSFISDVETLPRNVQIKHLQKAITQNKSNVALTFTLAYLHSLEKDYSLAASVIFEYIANTEAKSPNEAYAPGVLSALVSLYTLSGKRGVSFIEAFEAAISHWSKHPGVLETTAFQSLFADAAIALSGTGKESLVKEKLEEAYNKDPSNVVIAAGLLGLGDAEITDKYSSQASKLLSISEATAGINVDSLSLAGLEPLLKKRSAPEADKQSSEIKRKHKKPRLPKNYDAEKQPDPQRWIPLRDRSNYKPPKTQGKKKVLASTQGGQADESLSVSSGSGQPSATVATSKPKTKNVKKTKKGKGRR